MRPSVDCQQELALGHAALANRDFAAATLHFGRAHGAYHDDKSLHVAARWGMTRAALHRGQFRMTLTQWTLGVLAAILD
jgi:hypothetical protein